MLIVKEGLGKRLGELRLAHARGTEEEEGAYGTSGIGDACAGADDGFRDLLHRLVLPDDTLMQDIVEVQDLLALALHELGERDARPAGDHPRDLLFRHGVTEKSVLLFALVARLFELFLELGQTAVFELRGFGVIADALRRLYLAAHFLHFRLEVGDGVYARLLALPLRLHLVELVVELRKLGLDVSKAFLGKVVRLL